MTRCLSSSAICASPNQPRVTRAVPAITAVLSEHRRQGELVTAATDDLLSGRPSAGLGVLTSELCRHIEIEERLLLPRYRELASDESPELSPDLILRDHQIIRCRIAELRDSTTGDLARLRSLRALAHLLEHHDEREARGMVAVLDAQLAPDEAEALAAAFSAAGEGLVADPQVSLLAAETTARTNAIERLQTALIRGQDTDTTLDQIARAGSAALHPGLARRMESLIARIRAGTNGAPADRRSAFDASETLRRLFETQRITVS